MASLLGEHLFQISGQGPPPSKDFYQLVVTKSEVIWRSWKISLRHECRGASPEEVKTSHEDFLQSKMQHPVGQVAIVFGQRILDYARALCEGKYDYLERLPDGTLLQILSFLGLKDMSILAQVSQRFRKLCNSEMFWEQIVRNRCAEFTGDLEGVGNAMGWRKMYFALFHSNGSDEQE